MIRCCRGNGGRGSGHAHWLALISDHSIQWRVARSLPTLDASTAMAHGWPKRGELLRINPWSTHQPHNPMALWLRFLDHWNVIGLHLLFTGWSLICLMMWPKDGNGCYDPSKETPMSDGVLARVAGDHPSLEESCNIFSPSWTCKWLVGGVNPSEKYCIVSWISWDYYYYYSQYMEK